MSRPSRHRLGVVGDTHGLFRPELVTAFRGVELIVHAGDVGKEAVLDSLRTLAPVIAVRGNMDHERWAARLRRAEVIEVGEVTLYALHDLEKLQLDPAAAGFQAVITGHSHHPALVRRNGVLYLNPGSAGPQRSSAPASAALMEIEGKEIDVRFVELSL